MIAAEFFTAIKNKIPRIKLVSAKKWETSKAEEVFVGSGFTNGSCLLNYNSMKNLKNQK
ncbi:hypothetical protein V3595_22140 [Bacillus sp. CFBP9009]